MKFNILSLVVILVLSITLSACGGNGKTGEDAKTTIEFMHSSVEQERLAVIKKVRER
jgi:multiple sugar transport system substrate-binding protein